MGQLALFTGLIRAQYLALHPAPSLQAIMAGAALATQVGGALLLVPRLGLVGGALAFALTHVITGWIMPWLFAHMRPCARLQTTALWSSLQPQVWREILRTIR